MGDHGIDVNFGESGRHRAGSDRPVRPDASALLDMLTVLQSALGEATRSGDRAGIRAAAAGRAACWTALADLADEVHPAYALACRRLARVEGGWSPEGAEDADGPAANLGRHSAARRPGTAGGPRPWTVTIGRHAVERQALRRPAARSGRHWAPDEPIAWPEPDEPVAPDPIHEPTAQQPAARTAVRRLTVAAILERALAHETPVTALRPAPIPVPGQAAVIAGAGDTAAGAEVDERRAVEQCVRHAGGERTVPARGELWSAPAPDGEWSPARDELPAVSDRLPTQRRGEPEVSRQRVEPDRTAGMSRAVGWHPVPRPRHSADDRPIPGPEAAEKLAG